MATPQPPNNPQQQAQPPQPRGRHARIVPRGAPAIRAGRRPLHFRGQMPNERVIWIRRKHWLFLLAPAWPALLSLLALALIARFLGSSGAGQLFTILALALFLVMTVRWVVVNLGDWVFHYYILTNQRVIASKGFFRPDRREAVLRSVVQVLVQRPSPILIWLNIGDVSVRVIGAQVDMPGVWRPRAIGDSILATQEFPDGPPTGQAQAAAAPKLRSQKVQAALDKLAEPVAILPPPPPRRPPFLGMLHRKVPIRLFQGEQVVDVIYRHWFVLLVRLLPALIVFLLGIIGGTLLRRINGPLAGDLPMYLTLGGIVVGLGWAVLIYLNFVDDIFVLTTHRVIDIDRLIFILTEYSNDAPFSRVQDVHVEVGLVGNILGFGTIVVETSGRKYPIKMTDIPHALRVMDHIFALINDLRERESAQALNKQKKENYQWIATVLGEVLVAVPDVRGMPVLDAMARARGVGLKLVVESERQAPGSPPGTVLDQLPSPGTTDLPENELRVTLSGRGVPAATP